MFEVYEARTMFICFFVGGNSVGALHATPKNNENMHSTWALHATPLHPERLRTCLEELPACRLAG
ncbi:MAG: hypothetical protein LBM07_01635 [Culturomica sp.]|nr:hypothetical protein [Culturomica sp.]